MSRFARLINAVPPPAKPDRDEEVVREETREPQQSSQPQSSSQLPEQPDGGYHSSQLQGGSQPPHNLESPEREPQQSNQLQGSSQPRSSSQPQESRLNLLAALPDAKGHMETPYQLLDHLFRHLDPFEQAVYLQLYRLSWGWKKARCRVSNPKLADRSNMSLAMVKKVVMKLIAKGLIEKGGSVQGYGRDQGVEYIIYAPSWQLLRSSQLQGSSQPHSSSQLQQSTNKDKNKNIDQKGDVASLDSQNCPDCYGTGFWYPDGTEKGVARCMHRRHPA